MSQGRGTNTRARRRRGSPRWIALAIIAAAAGALAVWAGTRPPAVQVARVERGDLSDQLAATGTVEAPQATVTPRVIGKVEAIYAHEGDTVQTGQLLTRLESAQQRAAVAAQQAQLAAAQREVARLGAALAQERAAAPARVAQAEAVLKSAQAQASLASQNYERANRLFAGGAISRQELDRTRTALDAAQQDVRAAQAALSQARVGSQVSTLEQSLKAAQAAVAQAQAGLTAARSELAQTEVRAPISGRIGRRYLDVGDLAGPTSPVYLIVANRPLWVTAEIDEEDIALVRVGLPVQVEAEGLAAPVPGRIVDIGPVAVPRGLPQVRARVVRARVELERTPPELTPDMNVDITATVVLTRNALLVPLDAITTEDGRSSVWVVTDGRVRRRQIGVGRRTFRMAEVTKGLREGERVATSGLEPLREGRRVRVRAGAPDAR
jgi:RND family efflux transporter MFP subunit